MSAIFNTQQNCIQSWIVDGNNIKLLWTGKNRIHAEIHEKNGRLGTLFLDRIFGISKEWMQSPQVLQSALQHSYIRLSRTEEGESHLHISGRLLGGGQGPSTDRSVNPSENIRFEDRSHSSQSHEHSFVEEAGEHAAMHAIGHALGGVLGSVVASLLHTPSVNEGEDKWVVEQHANRKQERQPKGKNH